MGGKKGGPGMTVGGSSILIIFILLCLTTFATLSLISANADLGLTERAVRATEQYYEADARAVATVAAVDRVLLEHAGKPPGAYLTAVRAGLPASVTPAGDTGGGLELAFTEPIDDSRSLEVRLRVPSDPGAGGRCEIIAWRMFNTGEWEPEPGGMNLIGEEDFRLFAGDGALPFPAE